VRSPNDPRLLPRRHPTLLALRVSCGPGETGDSHHPRPGTHGNEPPVLDWAVMQDPFGNEFCLVDQLTQAEINAVLEAMNGGASTDREWRVAAGRTS
jgi:hypothetical protein